MDEINDVNDFSISPYENMPGRCFIGDRSLQNFNEYNYCHESKFYIIINEIPQCNYKYIGTINKIISYTGIKSDIEALPELLDIQNHPQYVG